eukprot:1020035-Prorocentrum_minimum.AAC.1
MWRGVHQAMDAGVIISGHQPTIRERMLARQVSTHPPRRQLAACTTHPVAPFASLSPTPLTLRSLLPVSNIPSNTPLTSPLTPL